MTHEQEPVVFEAPVELQDQEINELSYTDYSLIRNVMGKLRMPHPIRRISQQVGEFLDGMGPI